MGYERETMELRWLVGVLNMSDCMVVSKVSLVCLTSECLSFLLEDTASTVLSLDGYDTQLKC